MGSYLSIRNDTIDVWSVKIGHDEAAVKTVANVSLVIAGVSTIVTGAALVAPVVGAAAWMGGAMGVSEFAVSCMVSATAVAAAVAAVARPVAAISSHVKWTSRVVSLITSSLSDKGYIHLQPGETKRYGKMTLSLWQQADCLRTQD